MKNLRNIAFAMVVMAVGTTLGCDSDKPPPQNGTAGTTGAAGTTGTAIKLETWMEGIAKNGEVEVSAMPDNTLFTVTDKQPVSAGEATATQEAGKTTIVYEEDPAKLRFLFEADPRFGAQ